MSGFSPSAYRSIHRDRTVVENKIERATLLRVLRFARPHRRLIGWFLVITVFDAGLVVVPPLLVQQLVDKGINGDNATLVLWLAFAMGIAAIADAALGFGSGWLSSRIGEGLIYDLRTKVFAHVQRQSLAFFTRTQTGALVSRLNNDVIGAQSAFTSTLSGTVSNIISVVVVGITMLALSWQVTLLPLLLFPILLLASRWVSSRMAVLTRERMNGNADMGNAMTERFNVGGAMLLKLFGHRETEDAMFADKAANVRDLGVRIAVLSRMFFAAMTLVPSLATALVYGVGGYLAVNGNLSVGTVIALATLLLRLLGPLQGLSNVRVDVMTALVSFDRVFEVLDLPSPIQEKPDAVALPRSAASLQFEDVSFSYPRADEISLASLENVARAESRDSGEVLHRLGFAAEPGQMVALVGPSGAGKTTVTHLVARLYDATSGVVRVGGEDVRDVTLQSLEDVVGYVTQDAHMFHDTIRENLLYARPGADRRADLVGARSRPDRRAGPVAARRARHRGRRPWLSPVRRRAAAARDRTPAAQGASDRRARRGDRPPRQRVRGRCSAGSRRGARRPHVAGDRTPALHGPRRRPDPGGRGGADRPARHPRTAVGAGWPLRRPLPHPVPARRDRDAPAGGVAVGSAVWISDSPTASSW